MVVYYTMNTYSKQQQQKRFINNDQNDDDDDNNVRQSIKSLCNKKKNKRLKLIWIFSSSFIFLESLIQK